MIFFRQLMILALVLLLSLCMISCEKKKEGKVIITEQEFVLRKDKENQYTIDVRGKIRNVGEVDVKKVVVTGYCRSCSTVWVVGQWVVSPEIEKMPEQKDIISYIAAGNEESFSFTGITDMLLAADQTTPEMPEKMEVVIESFETVDQ